MTARIAIACALAASLAAPGAVYAWGSKSQREASAPTSSGYENAHEAVSDAAITAKVKTQLATDKEVSATRIHVDTDKGVVKLSGNARSSQEAERAVQIAQGTDGVVSVESDIEVASAAK